MVLPQAVSRLIKVFSFILLLGILFANSVLATVAVIPFLFIAAGFLIKQPSRIFITRKYNKDVLYAGDALHVILEIRIESGIGFVLLSDILPVHFKVVKGSNFVVIWKGFSIKNATLSYIVKCTTFGVHHLGKVTAVSRHFLYNHTVQGEIYKEVEIEVRPRLLETKMIKNTSNLTRIPMPLGAIAKNGIPTLDFKEIRLYSYGDSFKYINWKATSRNVYRGELWPVVNEYEKEGKKAVWIFLDRSKSMDFGSNIKDVFECGLEAVGGLSDYYIKEQCFVSLCTYNGDDLFIYPGTGKKQQYRILRELIKLNSSKKTEPKKVSQKALSLKETVLRHRGYYGGTRPLFIVVTRHDKEISKELTDGIMEMTKYTGNLKGHLQVMVVNICGYELVAENVSEKIAAGILDFRDKMSSTDLRKSCIWVDWNPAKSSFSNALLKQVVKK